MKIARNLEKIILVLCDFSLSIGQNVYDRAFSCEGNVSVSYFFILANRY